MTGSSFEAVRAKSSAQLQGKSQVAPARPLRHKCACAGSVTGGECEACKKERGGTLQRAIVYTTASTAVSPIVHEVLRTPGQPLDAATRAVMESRFHHDFSQVRVHADERASSGAREVNGLAYAVGRDIFFNAGAYNPAAPAGRWVLAHELAHVVQQGDARASADSEIELNASDAVEREADIAATAAVDGFGNSRTAVSSRPGAPSLMRLTPAEFRGKLGATADQKTAIAALFANRTFISLWDYLAKCPAAPKLDLGPLHLKVTPGLKIGGVERFGGYIPVARTLEINPTKPEHAENPAELVDTITHELIHAVDDLQGDCVKAGAGAAPLAGAATAAPPPRAAVAGTPAETKLMTELGPGASDPCGEFLDINKAAQQMVIQIIREDIKVAKVGKPTVTFVNEILRRDPAALKAYTTCRDAACAKPDPKQRAKAVAVCSSDIIAKFMPKELAP